LDHLIGTQKWVTEVTADVMPPDDNPQNSTTSSEDVDVDVAPVTMVVVHGIVMGPTVSAYKME